jgi:hypothetical protein
VHCHLTCVLVKDKQLTLRRKLNKKGLCEGFLNFQLKHSGHMIYRARYKVILQSASEGCASCQVAEQAITALGKLIPTPRAEIEFTTLDGFKEAHKLLIQYVTNYFQIDYFHREYTIELYSFPGQP